MAGASPRGGMKSITRTEPVSVSQSVSRMSVHLRQLRRPLHASPRGASSHRPFSGVPSSAAKHAPESKRGKQSQSIDPLLAISAAVCMSLTIP